jgi:hypothetical protein
MPIIRNYSCGCGFQCQDETQAVEHAKATYHEIHGLVKVIPKRNILQRQTRPVHSHIENGRLVIDEEAT